MSDLTMFIRCRPSGTKSWPWMIERKSSNGTTEPVYLPQMKVDNEYEFQCSHSDDPTWVPDPPFRLMRTVVGIERRGEDSTLCAWTHNSTAIILGWAPLEEKLKTLQQAVAKGKIGTRRGTPYNEAQLKEFRARANAFRRSPSLTLLKRAVCDWSHMICEFEMGHYPRGTLFYRVRADDNLDSVNDLWEPPSELRQMGRAGDSALYVALEGNTAIAEKNMQSAERDFAIILYKAAKPINGIVFFEDVHYNDMGKCLRELCLEVLYRPCITDEDYAMTNFILQNFLNHPSDDRMESQDMVCYSSVARSGGTNVAFNAERAREKLDILNVYRRVRARLLPVRNPQTTSRVMQFQVKRPVGIIVNGELEYTNNPSLYHLSKLLPQMELPNLDRFRTKGEK